MRHRIALTEIPLTQGGRIGFQVENAMAAVAAAWALGLEWPVVHAGLASFINDAATAPGRFNTFSYQGAMVIADYGHNPDAMRALVAAVEAAHGAIDLFCANAGVGDGDDVLGELTPACLRRALSEAAG